MEGNHGGGGGRMQASMGSSAAGMVGVDMSLTHHNNHHRNPQPRQHHFLPFPHHDSSLIDDPSQQQPIRQAYTSAYPMQQQQQQQTPPLNLLSEDVQVGDDAAKCFSQQQQQQRSSSSPSPSPWHRMKWTDNMVRLLIMIVYCVGDDGNTTGTSEAEHHHQPPSSSGGSKGKKTLTSSPSPSSGLQLLQKKGKWKSVSRAMMEKGFYVSPQQCEDKFNDLNKRYKRVNELLGKGTACQVVENQALLDSMDRLSPKAKDEARKLLNSKHLFFREMCAYHNSGGSVPCTAAAAGAPAANSSAVLSQPPHPSLPVDQPQQQQQQRCFHHTSVDTSTISFRGGEVLFVDKGSGHHGTSKRRLGGVNEVAIEKENHDVDYDDDDDDDDEDDEEEEVEDDYDDDDNETEGDNKSKHHSKRKESSKQEARGTCMLLSNSPLSASPPLSMSLQSSSPVPMPASMEQLRSDLIGSLASMGEQQQRQWLKRKSAELEEQRVSYQSRGLELKRQRFKWLRFSSNKEQEMERMKLSNERLSLENDRMLLLLRQKEHDLINAPANGDHLHHNPLLH